MRRLRYLVNKFEKLGECATREFKPGSNGEDAQAAADIIDAWCASKTQVNPLIYRVRQEILDGTLEARHRLFLPNSTVS